MAGMNRLLPKLLFRIAGATVLCGGLLASGLLDHVSGSDKAVFAGLLIGLITIATFVIEAVCERAKYQFSLSALLVTMTLAAIVLGIIAYVARK